MRREHFQHDALRLSYLDAANGGRPLIALHAHWMEALTFAPLAAELGPEWRVIALDQRGHGHSDRARTYTRADYLDNLLALYEHLRIETAVLLGNSLGGVNAYQFAARHPDRVRALIIEDIGAVVENDLSFVLNWEGTFARREELEERVGPRLAPYLAMSFRETPAGWRLAFEPQDMLASQEQLNGDHWQDWLASDCPALLIRGRDSRVTTAEHLEEMARRRPNTTLRTLPGGHVLHADDPVEFAATVRGFLARSGV